SVGDTIEPEQPVLELETDKATVEVPSSVSGVVKEIHVKSGETVQVGQLILTVENGAPAKPTASQPEAVTQTAEQEPPDEPEPAAATAPRDLEAEATSPPPSETATAPIATEFKLPELGENIQAGDVINILVAVGDTVAEDQPVLELETDKATVEVPSSVSGVVKEIHVKAGETAQVGQLILTLETTTPTPKTEGQPAAVAKQPEPQPSKQETQPQLAPAEPPAPEPTKRPATPESTRRGVDDDRREAHDQREGQATATRGQGETAASPSHLPAPLPPTARPQPEAAYSAVPAAPNIRRLAREIGVDITQVPGSGPDGRISMADVKNYARRRNLAEIMAPTGQIAAAPLPDFSKWGEVEREAMSNIRRKTAEHLGQAWATIPHVTQFAQADISEIEELRKRFAKTVETAGAKLTLTAILLKVVTSVLKSLPQFNASVDMAKNEIVHKKYYHIGVAVDTDRGLLVPVIRNVDQKNILELAVELNEVAERARNKKLSLDDMQGGTFTITNLGGIGGSYFTPIVNAPEVAILGVARGQMEPVYKNGQFEPRLMLPLALSYDHRIIDGADGARFLKSLVEHLEQPFLTALQGW
ncbi:MAG TPA: 2-oxo acid dehydrogenase subunit E2, partial [Anaerolineae bacterium]|nr:2-oxo acid dehydrogenase subunit E2 [Anaerolineae bacterium]